MEYEELDDLKYIKKYYGEKMSHLCRDLFSSILECPGLLYHLISTHFYQSKSLYYDIVNEQKEESFKNYIYSFYNTELEETKSNESVKELLESVGYDIYECKNNEDVLKFKKYYVEGEALCTFRDPNRINNHHIFFIVKKNVSDIKREDFMCPQREDEYGVSVLDLQFDKGSRQRVSIKCRYNHTVNNPDATYSNNLDMIVSGLADAFVREYGFNIAKEYKTNFELDHYIQANDGKFYKYNYEIMNIHYCIDNIIISGGEVVKDYMDKSRYLLFDYFILDLQEKKLVEYDQDLYDSFIFLVRNIKKIEINKIDNNKELKLIYNTFGETIITLDSNNRIIKFENNSIVKLRKKFLYYNVFISDIKLEKLRLCGDYFLNDNINLKKLDLPNLVKCGNSFLKNSELESINLPKLIQCGDFFLSQNDKIRSINLPNLECCGINFLGSNYNLEELTLPSLEECGKCFLYWNTELEEIELPNLRLCGSYFLKRNRKIEKVSLPNLEECGNEFLLVNSSLKKLELPKLAICGDRFVYYNTDIEEIYLPLLESCGFSFLGFNTSLKKLDLPLLKECNSAFLCDNDCLTEVSLPSLEECVSMFLCKNNTLEYLSLPSLVEAGEDFMSNNNSLKKLDLPKLKIVGEVFLCKNTSLEEINMPSLEEHGRYFLEERQELAQEIRNRKKILKL